MDDLKRVSISKKYMNDLCDVINANFLKTTLDILDENDPGTKLVLSTTEAYKQALMEIIFGDKKGEE